jgi:hypothetical protein
MLLANPAAAQVYKCQDASGKAVYSDQPCANTNKTVQVRTEDKVSREAMRQARETHEANRQELRLIERENSTLSSRRESKISEQGIQSAEQRATRRKMAQEREQREAEWQRQVQPKPNGKSSEFATTPYVDEHRYRAYPYGNDSRSRYVDPATKVTPHQRRCIFVPSAQKIVCN